MEKSPKPFLRKCTMRTNLDVKYEEREQVKRLGAKWDCARKVWFIEDVEKIHIFLKWIPEKLKKRNKKKRVKSRTRKLKKDRARDEGKEAREDETRREVKNDGRLVVKR